MPALAKGSKVLVSGSNGYIAMWVVRILLERGYSVRGTEGAFDEAVKGVAAIEHMASPFHSNVKDPEEFFRPAVQGTVGILKSALKNGTDVKRIVVTSSCAAVMSPPPKPSVFSERDWNLTSPREVEELGAKSPPMTIYRASKVLAEKSAWEFYEKVKSEVHWDLTVINPPFVFGPPIHDIASLNSGGSCSSYTWVDVRDTAMGHVLALEKGEAGGERIITCAGSFIWQEWLDALSSISPNPLPSHAIFRGFPEILEGEKVYQVSYDTSKEARILRVKFHTKVETSKDTLEEFATRGW
ncbi:hypothetical protein BDZ97DRAFT_1940549 [Flammula alnicola]|nr:hypothetical protein BDZ97DRAFT_1940549 [Flammula alnicola]